MPNRRTRCEANARPGRSGRESWSGDRRDDDPEQEGDRDIRDDRRQEQRDQARHGRDRDRGGKTGSDRPRSLRSRRAAGQDGARFGVSLGLRRFPLDAGTASQGSKVNSGAPRGAAHAVELEGVVGVGLVGEGSGLRMRRATGRRTGLRPAIPQAERQAPAVHGRRSLEVVDEARRRPSPRHGPSRRRPSGGPRSAPGRRVERKATMYHSPGSTSSVQASQVKASATARSAYRSETGSSRSKQGRDGWPMAMQHSESEARLPCHETVVCHDTRQKYGSHPISSSARAALTSRAAS